ncbi:MAG: VCBS repeat-containing protein [Bacteroidetes bacterium]|nr:VCBS repeat-containing protein [Bacteroidota bacterium]
MKKNLNQLYTAPNRSRLRFHLNLFSLAHRTLPIALWLLTANCFAVIDTLKHYNPATANSNSSVPASIYPSQYACFVPPAPGYIKSIVITLGGSSSTGSATVHIYGHEGGEPVPLLEQDLITPIVVNKTIAGNQKITVNLATPVRVDNNLFFIKVNGFSPNVTLIQDKTVHAPFCSSISGGDFYFQRVKDASNVFYYSTNAFVIDVLMDYTEGTTSPQYFKDITTAAGINTNLSNNCVAWADINKDGYLDLMVAGKLYKNMGNSTCTDITASARITSSGISTFIDMNNDGKDDILFLNGSADNFIYINNGDETFTQHALNLTTPAFVSLSTVSIGDFNNDSYPDLFVGQLWTNNAQGKEIYHPHYLYMNDKNLGFKDTSSLMTPESLPYTMDTTIVGTTRAVRGAQFVDYNDDGKLDLFVGNYRLQPDELWRNNGDGTFTDVSYPLGLDINNYGASGHATGCDWADYDNDGDMDLLLPQLAHQVWTVQYDHRPTTIYKNNGAPTYDFTDTNPGVDKGLGIEYEETHAGANWGDLNNDGLLDFAICAFYGCRYSDVYLQKSDHTFEMKSFAFGVKDVTAPSDLTLVDFDNDGKLDLACGDEQVDNVAKFRLFKNTGPFWDNFVELDLVSTSGNKNAVGAKATVYAGGKVYTQYQMPHHGAFMSKGNRMHFGLGSASAIDSVFVRWPDGTTNSEKFTGLTINTFNILTQGGIVTLGVKKETKFLSNVNVYPNPASDQVSFNYELAADATVTLDIYSILGEKIPVINNDHQTAGQHVVQWNVKENVAPGIYSYRLQAGELQKTGLLVVQ